MTPEEFDKLGSEKPKKRRAKKPLSIAEFLEAAKMLGFQVQIPTSEEDINRQNQTLSTLGFIEQGDTRKKPDSKKLVGYLYAKHYIAGEVYGPGELTLSKDKSELFRSLLQQDQACIAAHQDTTSYNPTSQCFVITAPAKGQFSKVPVSETLFNSSAFLNAVAVTTGKADIRGQF